MTAELPPDNPPGVNGAPPEWWRKTVTGKGDLYAGIVETLPVNRGQGIPPATALVQFSGGPTEGVLYEQRYVDVPRARQVLLTRGFHRA